MSKSQLLEFCSPLVARILDANPRAYGELVVAHSTASQTQALLGGVTPEQLVMMPIKARAAAEAMLAGLWLWHDALEESHTISQSLSDATGSYWHAIMHRREGDFSNSKYWNARCRNHPAIAETARRAGEAFDPDTFVSRVTKVHTSPGSAEYDAAVRIQRIEWEALFDYCIAQAVGKEVK
jgi:hypothetical protein